MLNKAESAAIKAAYDELVSIANDDDNILCIISELETQFPEILCEESDSCDPGDMDGDATSALASAGWGTDEDYE